MTWQKVVITGFGGPQCRLQDQPGEQQQRQDDLKDKNRRNHRIAAGKRMPVTSAM